MKVFLKSFHVAFHYLGPAGVAGSALLLGSAAMYLALVMPETHQLQIHAAQLIQAKAHPRNAELDQAPEVGDAKALEEFYGQFPELKGLSGLIEDLHALADDAGVILELGEYKLQVEDDGKLFRYEILLPIKTGYPEMRRFLADALHTFPTLGLKDVSFKREAIGENVAQARLNFVLYLKRGP